ncbi:MAG: DUF2520 domain-containing protein [Acidimicrobiia bacterium]|nr:DUF2520 domain-containing protein [Acidimicrobiia bacterium]
MEVILAGPGRAGLSLALALTGAGHRLAGVLARRLEGLEAASAVLPGARWLEWHEPLPPADLLVIAVSDAAVAEVAGRLAPQAGAVAGVVHLSGLTSVGALGAFAPACPIGCFHPLQTLPNPRDGAARLKGAWVALTCDDDALFHRLVELAQSIGCRPFSLADDRKALYHAAASAAANYPVAALAVARRLFEAAGVGFGVAEPLVRAAVENALTLGPEAALTGPVARGDAGTVAAQMEAVHHGAPDLAEAFAALARATAEVAGTASRIEEALG